MKNIGIKLWSLLIAVALFAFVNSQSNRGVMTLIAPLELRNLPSEKVVLIPQLNQIQVTVRGPSYLLSGLASSPPSYIVRVPPDVGNRHFVSLQADALAIPPSVEVLGIEPPEIEYILDDLERRELRVVVPRIGSLHEDLKLKSLVVNPETIVVRGPSTELQDLETIETGAVDLREIQESITKELAIRMPGRFLRAETEAVEAKVEVRLVEVERIVRDVPVSVLNKTTEDSVLTPGSVDVELTGPKSVVESLSVSDIIAYVDTVDGSIHSGQARVQLRLPERVSLIQIKPEMVEVSTRDKR